MLFQLPLMIQSNTAVLLPNHEHLSAVFSCPILPINFEYKQRYITEINFNENIISGMVSTDMHYFLDAIRETGSHVYDLL